MAHDQFLRSLANDVILEHMLTPEALRIHRLNEDQGVWVTAYVTPAQVPPLSDAAVRYMVELTTRLRRERQMPR